MQGHVGLRSSASQLGALHICASTALMLRHENGRLTLLRETSMITSRISTSGKPQLLNFARYVFFSSHLGRNGAPLTRPRRRGPLRHLLYRPSSGGNHTCGSAVWGNAQRNELKQTRENGARGRGGGITGEHHASPFSLAGGPRRQRLKTRLAASKSEQ